MMIYIWLAVLGLCLGSFVNALVYRLHEQIERQTRSKGKKGKSKASANLSITQGRSICPHCKHQLSAMDLVPVFSWLALRGKCRYCGKSISWQYPLVELATAGLFVASYLFWPGDFAAVDVIQFGAWLVILVGFVALTVYDFRWMLLPNRIVYPLMGLASLLVGFNVVQDGLSSLWQPFLSVLIAGGIFYSLFIISRGRWIGGGDVKLGLLIGLVLADPLKAFLMLLLASTMGTVVVLPGLLLGKLKTTSRIPFGPFLIVACILAMLFGSSVIDWYKELFITPL